MTTKSEKLRLARLGKLHSEETKDKIRRSRLGKKHSEETKAKIRASRLGKSMPWETRQKIRMTLLSHYEGIREGVDDSAQFARDKSRDRVIYDSQGIPPLFS